jgi:hypothetical protein
MKAIADPALLTLMQKSIAAAPEMLEALQVIYSMRGSTDAAYSERVSAFALAAIAKATGAA